MNYWVSSDYHLGHFNIIKYCNRPFKSLDEMNETIIRNHNERVKPGDIVFHIGDFCFRNSPGGKAGEGVGVSGAQWEEKLNGKIIHIRGNHDKNNSTKTIIEGLLIKHCGEEIYMVHRAEHANLNYKINFVGHVHTAWRSSIVCDSKLKHQVTLINVGVDVNKFMPITIQEALKIGRKAVAYEHDNKKTMKSLQKTEA